MSREGKLEPVKSKNAKVEPKSTEISINNIKRGIKQLDKNHLINNVRIYNDDLLIGIKKTPEKNNASFYNDPEDSTKEYIINLLNKLNLNKHFDISNSYLYSGDSQSDTGLFTTKSLTQKKKPINAKPKTTESDFTMGTEKYRNKFEIKGEISRTDVENYRNDSSYINKIIRGKPAYDEDGEKINKNDIIQTIKEIDKSINKSILKEPITVFRGLRISKDFLQNIKKGKILLNKGYSSTSLDLQVAKEFTSLKNTHWGIDAVDDVYEGNIPVVMKIEVKQGSKGLYVDGFDDEFAQEEVLLPRNSNFLVKSIKKEKSKITLEVETK